MKFLSKKRTRLNLALQGGGAHGAFTWGVLDRLLEHDRFEFATISGTSAGAVNAVAVASGLSVSRAEARSTLDSFWQALGETATPKIPGADMAAYEAMMRPVLGGLMQIFTPAHLNPLDFDPLRDLLTAHIDFDRIRNNPKAELILAATDVETALPRLFRTGEITIDTVRASACLPSIQAAVEIDGRHYWDGGYTANPPIQALLTEPQAAEDTMIVQINPTRMPGAPRSSTTIADAIARITFQQPLLRDAQFVLDMRNAMPTWPFGAAKYAKAASRHRFHLVDGSPTTAALDPGTKLKPTPDLLAQLKQAGRSATDSWISRHENSVGHRETVDLNAHFFG